MPTAPRPRPRWTLEDTILQDALWSALNAEVIAPARCERLASMQMQQ